MGAMMTGPRLRLLIGAALLAALPGCVAVVAGTAGGLIVDEGIVENDGEFDPLEETALGRALFD